MGVVKMFISDLLIRQKDNLKIAIKQDNDILTYPILTCRFHTNIMAVIIREPLSKSAQFVGESRKPFGFTVSCYSTFIRACDTRHHK